MSKAQKITVAKNGPYVVTGSVPLTMSTIDTNDAGDAIAWGSVDDQSVSETFALCRCCDVNGSVWNQIEQSDDPAIRANLIRQVGNCPSGRLVVIDKVTRKPVEPELEPAVAIVEDPSMDCSGPLWVRGGIEMVGADGVAYERRNRMTLCRCGRSENKPFCNGAHASEPKFQDGMA